MVEDFVWPNKLDFNLSIRDAAPSEAIYLSDLSSRSKAYWPYDEEYLRQVVLSTFEIFQLTQNVLFVFTLKFDFLFSLKKIKN